MYVPFWRDHGVDGIGIRCGHLVVQFGAAITRARDRFARERVWSGRLPLRAPNAESERYPSGRGESHPVVWAGTVAAVETHPVQILD
jgi:hypothetical protein